MLLSEEFWSYLCNIYRSKNTTKIWIREINIGNPEKHEIGSGRKLLFTFSSWRFFDMRREKHNFFLCWLFHLTPTTCSPRHKLLVWPRRALKIDFLTQSLNLNELFFSNSKILSTSGHDVIHIPIFLFPIWGFYCDISDCHVPHHAHMNTCTQCVHLTNPCTKQKILSLTKPKAKIYKTKNDNVKKIPPQLYYTCRIESG